MKAYSSKKNLSTNKKACSSSMKKKTSSTSKKACRSRKTSNRSTILTSRTSKTSKKPPSKRVALRVLQEHTPTTGIAYYLTNNS